MSTGADAQPIRAGRVVQGLAIIATGYWAVALGRLIVDRATGEVATTGGWIFGVVVTSLVLIVFAVQTGMAITGRTWIDPQTRTLHREVFGRERVVPLTERTTLRVRQIGHPFFLVVSLTETDEPSLGLVSPMSGPSREFARRIATYADAMTVDAKSTSVLAVAAD